MKLDYSEINKLYKLCLEAGQKAEMTTPPILGGLQVILYDKKGEAVDDAMIAPDTHGSEKGLLETYKLGNCDGYETAEQVFLGWGQMLKLR